jgi:hypothetical protein
MGLPHHAVPHRVQEWWDTPGRVGYPFGITVCFHHAPHVAGSYPLIVNINPFFCIGASQKEMGNMFLQPVLDRKCLLFGNAEGRGGEVKRQGIFR